MGQRRRFFLLLEHVSESNGSIHSQGCNKTSEEAQWVLSCGDGGWKKFRVVFFFSLLLLQSRLKQFFWNFINCKKKKKKSWGKCFGIQIFGIWIFWKTCFANWVRNFLFCYFVGFVSLFWCNFKINEKKHHLPQRHCCSWLCCFPGVVVGLWEAFTIFSGPMTLDLLEYIDQKRHPLSSFTIKTTDALEVEVTVIRGVNLLQNVDISAKQTFSFLTWIKTHGVNFSS